MGHGARVVGDGATPTSLTLVRSLVERSRQTGVHALAASVDLDHSIVRDTAPEGCGGSELGDGVGAYAQPRLGQSVAEMRVHRSLVEGSARAPLVAFGGVAELTQSLLGDGSPVAAIYGDDDAFDSQRATLELDDALCPAGGSLEACSISRRDLQPALFARDADGQRVPMVTGIGDVRSGPNGGPVMGAVVWALAQDELPAAITDNHGSWSVSHIAAQRAQVVVTHAAGNMTRFDQINSPPADVPIEGAELGVIPLSLLSPEFANLLGSEIDFSKAILNMDTDRAGIAFDIQPDTASTLYYIQDQFPVAADQAGATFEDGEVFLLQQIPARARVSWSLPDNLASCSPAPYGQLASYEPNAFSIPLLPGGMSYVAFDCQP
jgi:hypothetical protein